MARLVALIFLGNISIARSGDPPPPNPQQPVDYVALINAEFKRDLTDNAADLYRSAASALVRDPVEGRLPTEPGCAWSGEQREQTDRYLARNGTALAQVVAAASKERCYFELYSESGTLFGSQLQGMPDMRFLGRLLALRGQLHLATGDVSGAVQDAVTLIAVARHLESQPSPVPYHSGLAVRGLAYSVLLELPRAPARDLDHWGVLARVEEADSGPTSPKAQFLYEKIAAWDAAQRLLKDEDADGLYIAEGTRVSLDGPGKPHVPPEKAIVFGPQTWDQVMQDIRQYFADLDKVADMNYPQALDAADKLAERVKCAEGSFMKMLSAHRRGVLHEYARAMAHYRGCLLVLRLHAYRALHARWPTDLQRMLSASQQTLAIDPFSGQPFVYQLENGAPHLYSVSENRVDDGGQVVRPPRELRWEKTGDFVFWPRP